MMLGWALTFVAVAILSGLFGFTGMAGQASWIAQIAFFVCLIAFVISLFVGRRRPMT